MLRMMASLSACSAIFGRYSQTCMPVTFAGDGPERAAGGPAGLHVEGVDLAGAAVHPQQDAALAALLAPRRRSVCEWNRPPQLATARPPAVSQRPLEEGAPAEVFAASDSGFMRHLRVPLAPRRDVPLAGERTIVQ